MFSFLKRAQGSIVISSPWYMAALCICVQADLMFVSTHTCLWFLSYGIHEICK